MESTANWEINERTFINLYLQYTIKRYVLQS